MWQPSPMWQITENLGMSDSKSIHSTVSIMGLRIWYILLLLFLASIVSLPGMPFNFLYYSAKSYLFFKVWIQLSSIPLSPFKINPDKIRCSSLMTPWHLNFKSILSLTLANFYRKLFIYLPFPLVSEVGVISYSFFSARISILCYKWHE